MKTCQEPAGTSLSGTPGLVRQICPWCPRWAGDTPGKKRPLDRPGTGGRRTRASWTPVCAASRGQGEGNCWGWRRWGRWRWAARSPPWPGSHPSPRPLNPQSRSHSARALWSSEFRMTDQKSVCKDRAHNHFYQLEKLDLLRVAMSSRDILDLSWHCKPWKAI